uniref:Immunoglobulin domain-containing protein n=1 Tax=Seriola lalandi dorsalis TaxID=1841481 RepID=A0A3B4XVV7_SERLL
PSASVIMLMWIYQGTSATMSLTGVLHKDITIECSHGNAFSNIKYFCKGACNNEDVLITSREQNKDSWSKYSIKDEGNTFFVTISRLTEDDAGTYWCGIERVGFDTYNEVILTVIKTSTNTQTAALLHPALQKSHTPPLQPCQQMNQQSFVMTELSDDHLQLCAAMLC